MHKILQRLFEPNFSPLRTPRINQSRQEVLQDTFRRVLQLEELTAQNNTLHCHLYVPALLAVPPSLNALLAAFFPSLQNLKAIVVY